VRLVDRIRCSIEDGTFAEFRTEFLGRYYRSSRAAAAPAASTS